MRRPGKIFIFAVAITGVMLLGLFNPAVSTFAQQPTGSVPTVTGTPDGPFVRVDPSIKTQIRIYSGPSSLGEYPAIGILLADETAPALARAKGKLDWIQIYYPGVPGSRGWVFANYVQLSPPSADLGTVEVPATPTPLSTPTIDPTLVAAFIGQQTPTRLPTFTPPPPIELPKFSDTNPNSKATGVPTGLLILSLALFGFFGVLISYLRGR
jgi:uncharacterized protein YraI